MRLPTLLLLLLSAVRSASAQDRPAESPGDPIDPATAPRPTLGAHRVDAPIEIDGRVDEAVWLQADSATDFVTALPLAGYPASERTVVRVLFDEEFIYVGAVLYDAEPERLTSPGLEQDFSTPDADMFGFSVDPFLDRQNGVMIGVSPAGAIFDAASFNDSRYINRAWEGVVHVATSVQPWGWEAEIAVPLTTLRFSASEGEQSWGMNFLRRIRRINEDSYWSPLDRQERLHKMSRAGTVEGLRGLRQGRNLTLKPYVKASRASGAAWDALDEAGGDADAGIDLKYGVTSRLTLDLTALTDFSQVDVDREQVNLTRFSLFFPEMRDFFLENDGIFTLGDVTERNYRTGSSPRDFMLFYSRSIGLSPQRTPIPIAGGGRLSGRIGETEVGLLNMQTQSSGSTPAENFTVARVRQPVLGSGDVGVMFINRQATGLESGESYNRSWGADANLRLFRYMIVNSYVAATDEPGVDGDRAAGYVQVAWRDSFLNTSAFVKHVGEAFNPAAGFIRRTGVRQAFATLGVHPSPSWEGISEVNPYVDVSAVETLDGDLETRFVKAGLATMFRDGGSLRVEYEDRFERLFEPTPITGVTLDAGDYGFTETSLTYMASGARPLSGRLTLSRGGFYDGDRRAVSGMLLFRPNAHVSFDVSGQHNALELGGRSVDADVVGGRVRYAYSPRLFASGFVQYNTSSEELVTNFRVNLIHAPLSDVFLVFTDRRDLETDESLDRVVTLKVTKLVAF